jgi:hypothetical protein
MKRSGKGKDLSHGSRCYFEDGSPLTGDSRMNP